MDTTEGKPAMVKSIQDTVNAIFTLISCRFHEFVTSHDTYPALLKAATGLDMDLEKFTEVGERIWNLERIFNIRAGFSRKDDCLPERCFTPIEGDLSEGAVLTRKQTDDMLDEYYALRGWDDEGVPTRETLNRLALKEGTVR
jgi:aldehyde:ferredoxin oxidoreductase